MKGVRVTEVVLGGYAMARGRLMIAEDGLKGVELWVIGLEG